MEKAYYHFFVDYQGGNEILDIDIKDINTIKKKIVYQWIKEKNIRYDGQTVSKETFQLLKIFKSDNPFLTELKARNISCVKSDYNITLCNNSCFENITQKITDECIRATKLKTMAYMIISLAVLAYVILCCFYAIPEQYNLFSIMAIKIKTELIPIITKGVTFFAAIIKLITSLLLYIKALKK